MIDETRSNLGSIYNSLQTTLRVQNYHRLSSQLAYTWSHSLDYETGMLPYVPQDPFNEAAEYGNSDYDVRNTFTGYVNYLLPNFGGPRRLTNGWEINSGFSFHGGTPYTVISSSNPSQNGEDADRAVQVIANPSCWDFSLDCGWGCAVVQPHCLCGCAGRHLFPDTPRAELQSGLRRCGRGLHQEHSRRGKGQHAVPR